MGKVEDKVGSGEYKSVFVIQNGNIEWIRIKKYKSSAQKK